MIKQGFISDPFFPSSQSPTSQNQNPISKIPSFPTPIQYPVRPEQSPNRQTQSPTLYQMMSDEQTREIGLISSASASDKNRAVHDSVMRVLAREGPNSGNGGLGCGDVRLTIGGREGGYRVSVDVHRKVLVEKSGFFAEKLRKNGVHSVEILDCDDVQVYVEVIGLMYEEEEVKKRLMGENVSRVLELLKVSSAILFDAGMKACLEYLEAVPWSEEEEEKVVSHLNQLELCDRSSQLLQRVVVEPSTSSTKADDIFINMLTGVLQAKDEKARRQMKTTISRLLREDATDSSLYDNQIDISKDTLYNLCHRCLTSLILCLSEATSIDDGKQDRGALMGEIAREADNMQWIVDILVDRKMGDEFVKLWSDQKELADLHSKIPVMYRHEISRITAQLCIAIGRGHILVPKETRYSLLSTWLEALYEDYGWMRRACRSMDKKLVEDGLSQTILTLPLPQQQTLLLNWFDRYLNKGDDCPNIQRAFEVWWRRAFVKQYAVEPQLQVAICD
ncbi:hypothetical protein Leryth_009478 [Lithospermum erythrorhizon]|nr:hypothetical protein Leryth_009478 [Lithospermum erythrorhizon]